MSLLCSRSFLQLMHFIKNLLQTELGTAKLFILASEKKKKGLKLKLIQLFRVLCVL